MPDLAQLNIAVKSDQVDQANKRLDELLKKAQQVNSTVTNLSSTMDQHNTTVSRLSNSYSGMIGTIGRLVAGYLSVGTAVKAIKLGADFERLEMGFATLVGDADKAKKVLGELVEFSVRSPFKYESVAHAARFMLALGYNIDEVQPKLKTLIDTTSALGGDFQLLDRVILALGQMRAKGVVNAEEMRQLAEAGIPAWKILADAIGVDIPRAMKLVENRAVSSGVAVEIFFRALEQRYGGMTQKLSNTTAGLLDVMRNQILIVMRDIGTSAIEAFGIDDKLRQLVELTSEWRPILVDVLRLLGGLPPKNQETAETAQKIVNILRELINILAVIFAYKVAVFVGELVVGVLSLVLNINKLNSALRTTQGIVASLIAIVLAFELGRYFYDEFKIVQETMAAVILFFQNGWERIKYGFNVTIDAIKFGWDATIAEMKQVFGESIVLIVSGLEKLPDTLLASINLSKAALGGLKTYASDLVMTPGPRPLQAQLDARSKELDAALKANEAVYNTSIASIERDFGGEDRRGQNPIDFIAEDVKNAISKLIPDLSLMTAKTTEAAASQAQLNEQTKDAIPGLDAFKERIAAERNGIEKMIDAVRDESDAIGQGAVARELAKKTREAENMAIRDQIKDSDKLIDQLRKEITLLHQRKLEWELQKRIDRQTDNRKLLGLSDEDAAVQREMIEIQRQARDEGVQLSQDRLDALERETRATYQLKEYYDRVRATAVGFGNEIADALEQVVFRFKSATQAAEDLLRALAQLVFRQAVLTPIATGISNSILGAFGPPAGSALGNVFRGGSIVPFASGGVVSSPTYFPMSGGRTGLMGESGDEAIVPLARTNGNELGIKATGLSPTVNVKMTVVANNPAEFKRTERQLSRRISRMLARG